jgi:hypothetical protein
VAIQLAESVGHAGKNRSDDVLAVQVNLNRIPVGEGGPSIPLDPDAKVGPMTINAIARFQKHQFKWSDGRIDPKGKTHQRLNQILNTLPAIPDSGVNGNSHSSPLVWPDPALKAPMLARVLSNLPPQVVEAGAEAWLSNLSPARLTIVDVALQEAKPYPGKVSDMEGQTSLQVDPWDGKQKRIRHGWRRLHEYFIQASVSVNMNIPEEREGILCWNKRVQKEKLPQAKDTTPGVHWCGIMATWVLKNAQNRWPNFHHRPLRWMSPLISMPSLLAMNNGGKLDLNPGDVAVILKNTHHFTLISPPMGNPKSPVVWAVSGNDEYQSILVKTFPVSLILMRYFGDDIFL